MTSSALVVANLLNINDLVSFRKQKRFHDGEDFVLDRGTTQDSCAFLSCANEHLVMTYNISCPSFLRQSGSLLCTHRMYGGDWHRDHITKLSIVNWSIKDV